MIQQPAWQFDELSQVGVDYADPAEVAAYEERHRRFRDLDAENRRLIERLGLSGHETLIDIGSGTGLFILAAAPHCAKIHAVDVSEAMLAFAQGRAKEAGVAAEPPALRQTEHRFLDHLRHETQVVAKRPADAPPERAAGAIVREHHDVALADAGLTQGGQSRLDQPAPDAARHRAIVSS